MVSSNSTTSARSPFGPLGIPTDRIDTIPRQMRMIEFLHPMDSIGGPSLLKLPAFDYILNPQPSTPAPESTSTPRPAQPSTPTPQVKWGVDYRTALIGCGILANNRWDGYFKSLDGKRVEETTEILSEPSYYFYLPATSATSCSATGAHAKAGDDCDYAVVHGFENWIFPKRKLPPPWQFYVPPEQDGNANSICSVTGLCVGLDKSHLIPVSQGDWFEQNSMDELSGRTTRSTSTSIKLNDNMNQIHLRTDIHSHLDKSFLYIIPKPVPPDYTPSDTLPAIYTYEPRDGADDKQPSVYLAVQVLRQDGKFELYQLYHNVALQPLHGFRAEYLFAAFALKIFSCSYFFPKNLERKGLRIATGGGNLTHVEEIKTLPPAVPSERRRSPTKRARTADDNGDEAREACEAWDSTESEETEVYSYGNVPKKRKYNWASIPMNRGRTLERWSAKQNDDDDCGTYTCQITGRDLTEDEAWENERVWKDGGRRWGVL
ncbi:hypothetical protein F5X98DRAFT_386192 [Xylaria grammica]|nr:hypothetical protein F5X98DRAFT_386192 [Xylaria grammica]